MSYSKAKVGNLNRPDKGDVTFILKRHRVETPEGCLLENGDEVKFWERPGSKIGDIYLDKISCDKCVLLCDLYGKICGKAISG